MVAATALLAACGEEPQRARKQQMVKLLPDTPPPPPPPPKPEDKPPPPKPDDKPPPVEAPKPVEAPAPAALKSDEAAGDGPGGPMMAAPVTRDYTDQKIGQGTTIGGNGTADNNAAARLAANTYASAATRALHEFLARDREVKKRDYQVRIDLWLTPAGALQRAELVGSSGDADTDRALRAALDRFPGASSPPPARMPLPMRLLVTNRMMG